MPPFLWVPKSPREQAAMEKKERRGRCLSTTSLLTPVPTPPAPGCGRVDGAVPIPRVIQWYY